MMDFSRFEFLSFDCYGTLIDWEAGILSALQPVLAAHGVGSTDDAILHLYAEFETQEEQGPYRPYRQVLEQVVRRFGERIGFVPSAAELAALPESVKHWRPFPDTVDALRRLSARYKVAVISNIDDEMFAPTATQLGVEFAEVITAQQARAYKPSQQVFRLALQRLGIVADKLVHAAQSAYHDLVPAGQMGIASVWINRRAGKRGFGATLPAQARPALETPDLKTLADLALK
jgi:2-haloacid dehalogenase